MLFKTKTKEELKIQRDEFVERSSAGMIAFRRFIFAPNLLTFVISVVVGNAFGSTVKDLVSLTFNFFKALWSWLIRADHQFKMEQTSESLSTFIASSLTLLAISLAVFYFIQFINNWLIGTEEEKWGYDEPHQDSLDQQALQKENNELVRQNITLQKEIIELLKRKG
ncbi:large-conductance mechanosensitive channel [Fructobacillus sp. M2-14]|uniref:Large-conductance mechanosensitive channel n=1 Tax=Fructobacillus broussonetiae TaxID=2713173 RepID=A0ABS5R238_9LACO|nr:MscL family protein [Fructobacillus broussonetiae]MBS9338716.1 large-conductance mechanosensitive channel [Fructobacillus broussonetiae]